MPSEASTNRFPAAALLAAVALILPACDHDQPPGTVRQVVKVEELPGPVAAAAKKALPDVTLQDAWKNLDPKTKALHSYEVRGRNPRGKVREVRLSTEGAVLEIE